MTPYSFFYFIFIKDFYFLFLEKPKTLSRTVFGLIIDHFLAKFAQFLHVAELQSFFAVDENDGSEAESDHELIHVGDGRRVLCGELAWIGKHRIGSKVKDQRIFLEPVPAFLFHLFVQSCDIDSSAWFFIFLFFRHLIPKRRGGRRRRSKKRLTNEK